MGADIGRKLNLTDELIKTDPEQALVLIPHHLHKACFIPRHNRVTSQDLPMTVLLFWSMCRDRVRSRHVPHANVAYTDLLLPSPCQVTRTEKLTVEQLHHVCCENKLSG